jgi:hypothetical protein
MALLYGRAGRFTTQNGGFRPAQDAEEAALRKESRAVATSFAGGRRRAETGVRINLARGSAPPPPTAILAQTSIEKTRKDSALATERLANMRGRKDEAELGQIVEQIGELST